MIAIELNGQVHRVAAGTTLLELVDGLGLPPGQALALAVNRSVVPRQRWPATPVQSLDQIEIVRAIGGG